MFVTRLIKFYQKVIYASESSMSPIWSGMVQSKQARLTAALIDGNESAVQSVFDDPKEVLHGLDDPVMQYWGKDITTEFFGLLAQRIGVLPIPNRAQPSPTDNWKVLDGIDLRAKIERVLGPIKVANGFLSVCTENGIPYMHFLKLGQWFTVQSLMETEPKRVLEIGAGCGGLAQVAFQNGVEDYTIIDLPSVAVISAYYMSKVYGENKIWLAREADNPECVGRWFSYNDYADASSEYDLIANCNSFPEMSIESQDDYLKFIHANLASKGLFYSSNHESDMNNQRSVRAAINSHGGFKCIYRSQNMIRDGYVEEFYRRK